ncbi:MAG: hypothetical protein KJZ78_23290, partial [Bryobacteraceae bacterium]|nr:hypothetical protein [Bryobacteraceae bacterium]
EQATQRGQQLSEQFRTPLEDYEQKIGELNHLLSVGAIDADTAERARKGFRSGLGTFERPELPTAMLRGSVDEYNASLSLTTKDPMEAIRTAVDEQLDETIQQTKLLERIEQKTGKASVWSAPK